MYSLCIRLQFFKVFFVMLLHCAGAFRVRIVFAIIFLYLIRNVGEVSDCCMTLIHLYLWMT